MYLYREKDITNVLKMFHVWGIQIKSIWESFVTFLQLVKV